MKVEKKLTSVHVLEDIYRKFKINAIDGNINLQKLFNTMQHPFKVKVKHQRVGLFQRFHFLNLNY